MMPTLAQLLTDEQTARTHTASLEILDQVGLEVNNPRAREIYQRHGCRVDNENQRVTLPPNVVEEFVAQTPPKFTYRARNPEFDRTIPDDAPLVMTASSAPNIIDPVTGRERRADSKDIARIARLANELSGIDLFSVSVLAQDAPKGQYSLTRFFTALKHCQKPIRGSGDPGMDSESILKMAYTIAGSEEAYKQHPFITHHYCPIISPLKMDEMSTEMMMFYVKQGLPCHPTVVPNAGLSSPFTLPATLASGNAEFLSLATLTQMVKPGTPMLYSSLSTVGDMRSGAYAPGGIECGMLNMAHAQMARHYKIPCAGYIGLTNSKLVDAQAGFEKGMSCMGGVLAGMHVLQFVGLIDALMTFDYGMAVIDHEISLMLKRVVRGMEFSEENLALDEIREVGPAGMFIDTERTFALMKVGALMPEVANRDTRQAWTEAGGQDAQQKAMEIARELLGEDRKSLLSPEIEERLRAEFPGMVAGDVTIPDGWL